MSSQTIPAAAAPPSRIFRFLRWYIVLNSITFTLRNASMRLVISIALSAGIWAFVFLCSLEGFQLLQTFLPLSGEIIGTIFDLLFAALGVLLAFSTGIILYNSLFAGHEASFLLSCPVSADRIFAYKFQSALSFSSWGFVLIGSPVLLAYGLVYRQPSFDHVEGASWLFFVLLPAYFVGFILIPGTLGGVLCLAIVNLLPRSRTGASRPGIALLLGCLILAGFVVLVLYRVSTTLRSARLGTDMLGQMIGQVAFAQHPLMPSHWVGKGLRASARGNITGSLFHLALVWSNGLVGYVFATWLAGLTYRRGYDRLASGSDRRRLRRGIWMDSALSNLLGFLDEQTRLLIVKDFRVFRREPSQWAQIAIFSGLIILYFTNVRRFFIGDITWEYQNTISLLNVFATSLVLCTYTGRFIFPSLSLEGKRFWILGLLPLSRERLIWSKFAFSACGTLVLAEFLVTLSDLMLGVPWIVLGVHLVTVAIVALGLSGMSVGLGALMPNFRESDPSRIAVGFGGTINVVLGLAYVLVVLGFVAAPWHLMRHLVENGHVRITSVWTVTILCNGMLFGLALGAAAVFVPLRMGIAALNRTEF